VLRKEVYQDIEGCCNMTCVVVFCVTGTVEVGVLKASALDSDSVWNGPSCCGSYWCPPLVLGYFPVSLLYSGCMQVSKAKAIHGVVGTGQSGLLRVPHKYVQVKYKVCNLYVK
jgi:hypothetical protein